MTNFRVNVLYFPDSAESALGVGAGSSLCCKVLISSSFCCIWSKIESILLSKSSNIFSNARACFSASAICLYVSAMLRDSCVMIVINAERYALKQFVRCLNKCSLLHVQYRIYNDVHSCGVRYTNSKYSGFFQLSQSMYISSKANIHLCE